MMPLSQRIALCGFLLIAPTFAITVDDFSTSQGPLVTTAGAVSGPGIIGGVREFLPGHSFEAAGGIGTFSTPDGTGNVLVMGYDGVADLATRSGTFAPVDLTDGGLADLFLLSVTVLSSPASQPATVSLVLNLFDADGNSGSTAPFFVTSTGVASAALPTSGVDLTRITALSVPIFMSVRTLGEFTLSVDYFCTGNSTGCTSAPATVPEPSAFVLFGLGLAALTLRLRNR
ncbi:MAG: PEP-CTERM sorting domain-containing protein [Bryobacterales bacterium]|nr:PEP-CTERM sorting domain-containing protein [Acidobacteriota bacterium]MCB9384524.1 PEP-CTERM sorting domain-containing protein [Bryobacterales bacterium]